ncbi:FMN-dependent NADH-azoreductase [Novosphingobium guangzhouense]|uniref:FMN dependent NADH:quinone oxidoreductase n=1 Tax=Novosphingobium guangzhouense TaxID=1850347 RepID=A0A2K2FZ29_9SPHN|nr:FMN-dependent NADH-azoreductase [Novosphingobium guangzhouense]PNU04004.1 FMN-dependent NADH-azoreductase [Novosphingobium guangzhouense]
MKLLHLDSSILGDNSASRAISAAIVASLTKADPSLEVTYRDLAAEPLAHLTLDVLGNPEGTPELAQFLDADVVVIGAGFYNFSIPSQLKAWIDRIAIAGKTFRYTAEGPVGLVGDKKVYVALARGGYYGEGQPAAAFEHAESYLRAVLGFIGITEPTFVLAEGIAIDADTRAKSVATAIEQAGALAVAA